MARHPSRRAVLGAALALAAPHVARAAPRPVRLGVNSTRGSQYGQGCEVLAAAVAAHPALTALRIDVRYEAEMGDELAMLADCRRSTVDMMVCSTLVVGGFCPEAGLLDAPFIFSDVARGRAAMDGATGVEYADLLGARGIHVLAWCENGLRHISANRPIRTPADLQGLKLRVPQSEIALSSFRALGADARPLAFNDLYEALRTGQFDAEENPIATMESMKIAEVQKYLSLTGHIYSTGMFVASPDLIEDLSPGEQAALRDCAKLGALRTRQVAEAAQRDGVARLQQAGMVLVEGVDVAAFVAACKPGTQILGQRYGAERVARLITAGA